MLLIQAFSASEEGAFSFFDLLGDSVLVSDTAGRIVYVNAAFEATTGYSREEALGRSTSLLKSGFHPRSLYDQLWGDLQKAVPFRTIFTNKKKSGELYQEGVIISPVRGAGGGIDYYVAIGRTINAFRNNYEAFTVLAGALRAGIYLSRDKKLVYVNEELARYLGLTTAEVVDRDWLHFVAEEDRERVAGEIASNLENADPGQIEFRLIAEDGSRRWVMQSVRRMSFQGSGAMQGEFEAGYVIDITDRRLAEEKLQEVLALQDATLEAATDGILVVDGRATVVSGNRRFSNMWNLDFFSVDEGSLAPILEAMQAQMADPAGFRQALQAIEEGKITSANVELLDGREFSLLLKDFVSDGKLQGRVWSWRDVTERRRFEAALLQLANHDSLTGLLSRRRLQEVMQQALASSTPSSGAALLLLDLDRFKDINDSLGHQAGDGVLVSVAKVLTEAIPGQFISRFGGDEFVIFMPKASVATARAAADRLLEALAGRSFLAGGADVGVTASVGIALSPTHGSTPDELLANADVALYTAKEAGRNRYRVYSQRLRSRATLEARRSYQAELRDALQDRRWKLVAQPALSLSGDLPSIYKLKTRFLRRDGRLLPNARQSSFAERGGLVKSLERWTIREAVSLIGTRALDAQPRRFSLELPLRLLEDAEMLAFMQRLGRSSLEPEALLIELMISEGVTQPKRIEQAMRSLVEAGYSFMLCGAVGSNLSKLLRTLPIEIVRPNASLVGDILESRFSRELLTSLIRALHNQGKLTLIDDISNPRMLRVLRAIGADYARGPAVGRERALGSLTAAAALKDLAA